MGGSVNARPDLQDPPLSASEQDAIRNQLERLLAHPLFKHSKRYAPFLRYVVEHTLSDKSYNLKERTLGIEVFERLPDYDTNSDPVVRVTAGEIRKRIAQYYFEPVHQTELRIELPPGSYTPQFLLPAIKVDSSIETHAVVEHDQWHRHLPRVWLSISLIVLLVAGALVFLNFRSRLPHSTLDQFWEPVFQSSSSALIAVSAGCSLPSDAINRPPSTKPGDAPTITSLNSVTSTASGACAQEFVPFSDATTLANIAAYLRMKDKSLEFVRAQSTSYTDLRNHPTILIGGFNNEWTIRLCKPLRFCFRFDDRAGVSEIADQKSTSGTVWAVPKYWQQLPVDRVTIDYGLISRISDPITDQIVVIVAGVGSYGTLAAGEVLSNPKYMDAMVAGAPPGWSKKNLQVVIETQVINGDSGPPRVIASEYW